MPNAVFRQDAKHCPTVGLPSEVLKTALRAAIVGDTQGSGSAAKLASTSQRCAGVEHLPRHLVPHNHRLQYASCCTAPYPGLGCARTELNLRQHLRSRTRACAQEVGRAIAAHVHIHSLKHIKNTHCTRMGLVHTQWFSQPSVPLSSALTPKQQLQQYRRYNFAPALPQLSIWESDLTILTDEKPV
eukprot:scaffold237394_cov19-Tisochrysis_lutea.AAC.2